MNLNRLRFVKALAEIGSFSRAADVCCVTQPALSNAIAQLEAEFGGQIFARTTRSVALTAFGRHLLPHFEEVLNASDELCRSADAFLNPDHKLVRIGMSPLVDMRLLTCVLEPFRRDHPDVEIIFKECFLDDMDARLDSEQIDFGIRPYLAGRAMQKRHVYFPFYEEPLYFIPQSDRPDTAVTATSIQLRDIVHETFVLTPDVCGLTGTIQALFNEQGSSLKKYPGQALSYDVIQDWANLGIGAAILPLCKISPANRQIASRLLLASDRQASVRQNVIWNQNVAHAKHVDTCREYFRDVVPGLVAGLAA